MLVLCMFHLLHGLSDGCVDFAQTEGLRFIFPITIILTAGQIASTVDYMA